MRPALIFILMILNTPSCGNDDCYQSCLRLKPRIEAAFPDISVDCADPGWSGPEACETCLAGLERNLSGGSLLVNCLTDIGD